MRVAIECKNQAAPIGEPRIDGFVGKLRDIGIPLQQGVFVSASRYTKDAKERARKDGIRTLLVRGLSPDGLRASVTSAAYQSFIFLLAQVTEVSFFTKVPGALPHSPIFIDADGHLCGTIPHLILEKWQDGTLAAEVGANDLTLSIPENWVPFVADGRLIELEPRTIHARVSVVAFAHTIEGRAEHYALVDAETATAEKTGVRASFEGQAGQHAFVRFTTNALLDQYLGTRKGRKRYAADPGPKDSLQFSRSAPQSARRRKTNGIPSGPTRRVALDGRG